MIVGKFTPEINEMVSRIPALMGYLIVSREGIPYLVHINEIDGENVSLFSTMCATSYGAYRVMSNILGNHSETWPDSYVCLGLGDECLLIMEVPEKEALIVFILKHSAMDHLEDLRDIIKDVLDSIAEMDLTF